MAFKLSDFMSIFIVRHKASICKMEKGEKIKEGREEQRMTQQLKKRKKEKKTRKWSRKRDRKKRKIPICEKEK